MCVYVYLCVLGARVKRALDPLELALQMVVFHRTWMLGTQLSPL